MKLREIAPADAEFDARRTEVPVGGVTADSRIVKRGDVFVAIAGGKADGMRFIDPAIAAGAVAIVSERAPATPLPAGIAFVRVANARRALASIAAKFYPRQPPVIAAVTGTSGESSGALTTPDPIALHRSLEGLTDCGVTHLAIEASSHGLDQHRLDGLRIAAAGFTNITRDHLDYHPSFESYLAAKLRLFGELLAPGAAAIINVDHEHAKAFVAAAKTRGLIIMTVGRQGTGIRLLDSARDGLGQKLRLEYEAKLYRLRLPLVGEFQAENAVLAAGLAIATGDGADVVFAALEHLDGAKGRLERVGESRGAQIFVDYAHKPDALAKALDALRPYATGHLVVILGAGGDRDRGKRPLMGSVAAAKADRVIVTDDNPRSEDPAAIRAAILAAAPGAIEIGDRFEAIRRGIAELHTGDILLIAGKGHETGQIIGDRITPFSDHEAVATALKELAA